MSENGGWSKVFNMTANGSTIAKEKHQEESKVLVEIAYVAIFVFGIIGNTAMAFLLRRRRRHRSPSNLILLHVVISEMSVLLLNIPIDILLIHVDQRWIFGGAMCKVLWPIQTLSLGAFVWILTLLSYHRYRGIVCPLQKKLTTGTLKCLVAIIWFVSFVVVVPYGVCLDYQGGECVETWGVTTRKGFTVVFFAMQYAFPLVTTTYCYVKIAIAVRRGHTSVRRHISGTVLAESRRKKRNLSAIRTAVLFMTIFAICMLPHQVIWLWLEFGEGAYYNVRNILTFAYIFTFTSVFMNPLVYICSTPSVRAEFRRRESEIERRRMSSASSVADRRVSKKYSGTAASSGITSL